MRKLAFTPAGAAARARDHRTRATRAARAAASPPLNSPPSCARASRARATRCRAAAAVVKSPQEKRQCIWTRGTATPAATAAKGMRESGGNFRISFANFARVPRWERARLLFVEEGRRERGTRRGGSGGEVYIGDETLARARCSRARRWWWWWWR